MQDFFTDIASSEGQKEEKHFKATLAQSDRLMVGLNCLEPGQKQRVHDHADQDKFYFVVRGCGSFHLGGEERAAGPGVLVWAPAGMAHGVRNEGAERLVLLMGMAPGPPKPSA